VPGILCSALARDCPLRRTFFASRRAVSPKRPPLLVDRCPLISTHRTFFACRRTPTNKKPRGFSNRRARAVVSSPHTASRWPRVVDRRRMFVNRPGDFTRLALRSVDQPAHSANRRALCVGRRARAAVNRAFSSGRRPRYADRRLRTGCRRARAVNRRPLISIMTHRTAKIPTIFSLIPPLQDARGQARSSLPFLHFKEASEPFILSGARGMRAKRGALRRN